MNFAKLLPVTLLLISVAEFSSATDIVHYRDPQSGVPKKKNGAITEISGDKLQLESVSGRKTIYKLANVIRYETDWVENHDAAIQSLEKGDLKTAESKLTAATKQETRRWALRKILATRARVRFALQNYAGAANDFLKVIKADPPLGDFAAIPLCWKSIAAPSSMRPKLNEWLSSGDPTQKLIAASWLLTTSRAAALKSLTSLKSNTDSKIAFLAHAQLWRVESSTASKSDFADWATMLERMPEEISAGPRFVYATNILRKNFAASFEEQAILHLSNVGLMHPNHYQLAAEAMIIVARSKLQDNPIESAAAANVILKRFPNSNFVLEAEKIIRDQATKK